MPASTRVVPVRMEPRLVLVATLAFAAAILFVFARTYYLKSFFRTPALSPLLHVHGVVMTGWVALLAMQTMLVRLHRVHWHRVVGVLGAGWAVLVVILGSVTTVHAAMREVRGHTAFAAMQSSIAGIEMMQMVLFAGFVSAAVLLRRRPDYHGRLMLLTILCMLPSIVTRLPIDGITNRGVLLVVDGALLVLIGLDVLHRHRLHPAFGWAGGVFLLALDGAFFGAMTPWFQALGERLLS